VFNQRRAFILSALLFAVLQWQPAVAGENGQSEPPPRPSKPSFRDQIISEAEGKPVYLTAPGLFKLAEVEVKAGDTAAAITIYRALERDADLSTRCEARFRHGQLLAGQRKFAEAATLYRAILDEQPQAQRVRLELAAVLAQMGDLSGARRMLRQAQAGGLPQDVARVVDQYAAALRSRKPISASFELSLAPSTNINRATSATTLDTILAPIQLSDDARARSGLGIKIGGQITARLPIASKLSVLTRLSGQANLYRASSFNDELAAGQVGVEVELGKLRLQPLIGRSWRWYGDSPYAITDTASVNILKPLGRRAQVEANLGVGRADYRLNNLQDGPIYDISVAYERAISSRAGASITASFDRQDAHDPGYATRTGGIQLLGWRDAGKVSLYLTITLSRLVADDRLLLFPDKRKEWQIRATAGAVLRRLTVYHFAPLVRVSYERNQSTIGIYDYRRLGGEIGISRAF